MPDRFEFRPVREVDRSEPVWEVRAPGQDGELTVQVNVPDAAVEGLRNAAFHANPEDGGFNCWIVIAPEDGSNALL